MHDSIASALAACIREMPSLVKDGENKFAKYKYVPIDGYYEVLAKVMAKHGLTLVTREVAFDIIKVLASAETKGGASGPAQERTFAKVTYECDAYLVGQDPIPAVSSVTVLHAITGPQTAGSAASYAEKVFFRVLVKAVTGEPDGDAEQPHSVQSAPNDAFGGFAPEAKPAAKKPLPGKPVTAEAKAAEPQPGPEPEAPYDGPEGEGGDEASDRDDPLADVTRRAAGVIERMERNLYPVLKVGTTDHSIVDEIFRVFSPTETYGDLRRFWSDNLTVLTAMKEGSDEAKEAYKRIAGYVQAAVNVHKQNGTDK